MNAAASKGGDALKNLTEKRVTANGVEFSYLEAGSPNRPLALCLHGFPDTAVTWRHLLPALADAGFHAVAPWMRGYAPTEIPSDASYQQGAIGTDACALHDALGGGDDAVLIGHDWGALAAYSAAPHRPAYWRKIVTLAVAPLSAMATSFFNYAQLKRSFYMFVFQTPLAEMAVSLEDYAFIDKLWADWSPGYDGSFDIAKVKESLGRPENLSAALGYYRAMFDPSQHVEAYASAQAAASTAPPQPTLYLHGAEDGCMGMEVVGNVLPFLSEGSEQVTVPGCGHFLHLERPDEVNSHMVRFLTR